MIGRMVKMHEELSSYRCKTCDTHGTYKKWDGEPPCFFHQLKKLDNVKYEIYYEFCSKKCMIEYLRKSKK